MTDTLPPQYNPSSIEADLYRQWLVSGAFSPDGRDRSAPFVIMMPPPNVTSVLHMGHGLT